MGKILIVAEKPSVGRDIAHVLKCAGKGDGYLYSESHVVSWAVGHLVTLCEPEDYDERYKSWRGGTLPILPETIRLKPVESTKKQLNVLKKLFAESDVERIVCATDSGREGELIFRYIYSLLNCEKPFDRLWISSMTDAAIKEGFKNLKPGGEYDNLYYSAKCRSEADWLVGINATRAYTIRYGALLSVGRVQTPTLAMLVERQKEIDAFVPEDYWEVHGQFDGYKGVWFDAATKESKIKEEARAEEIVGKASGQTGVIESVDTEEKRQPPPLLYDLTELQRDCNKRFGFSAKKTLELAQELYEKRKLITYPRTDSRYVSADMIPKMNAALKRLADSPAYAEQAAYVLGLPSLPVTKRIVDDSKVTDHHAIIPTDAALRAESLGGDLFKVYDRVARRFLAVFYPHYVYSVTKIVTNAAGERFLTKGNTVINAGWMELYKHDPAEGKKSGEEADILPDVAQGDERQLTEARAMRKKTSPPKAYTEAMLLSAMENAGRFVEDEALKEQLKDSGLGTPATRAAIIERLLAVGYAERKGKTLAPTEKGVKLIAVVPNEMKSPETTGRWEKGLVSISRGGMNAGRFMGSIEKYVRFLVDSAGRAPGDVAFPQEQRRGRAGSGAKKAPSFGKCPLCGKADILENSKAFYCAGWQNGCTFKIWKDKPETRGMKLPEALVKRLKEARPSE